jgi:hypothetical protein
MRMQFELLNYSVLCINYNFLVPNEFETVFVVRFASQRETDIYVLT